jgi:SPP1 gp7 family putative phage head morphogenesis protein
MAEPFHPLRRIEIAYRKAIFDALRQMVEIRIEDGSEGQWLADLIGLAHSKELAQIGAAIAARMVRWVNVENAKSWRYASRQSQRSQMLYRLLQEEMSGTVGTRVQQIVRENATLISSIPYTVAGELTNEIMAAQQTGARHEVIARMMRNRFPILARHRVALIARTETSKASTALTRARSEDLGLSWFVWKTSHDVRVRPAHEHMEDVVCSWNDLPSPEALVHIRSKLGKYAPGDAPNCRCYPAPVLSLEDLYRNGSERRKVYANGNIQRMTRAQFARLSGIEARVAA